MMLLPGEVNARRFVLVGGCLLGRFRHPSLQGATRGAPEEGWTCRTRPRRYRLLGLHCRWLHNPLCCGDDRNFGGRRVSGVG